MLHTASHTGRWTRNILEHLVADQRGQCVHTDAGAFLGVGGAGQRVQQTYTPNRANVGQIRRMTIDVLSNDLPDRKLPASESSCALAPMQTSSRPSKMIFIVCWGVCVRLTSDSPVDQQKLMVFTRYLIS